MECYNLRSGKRECYIPVQFQLARDEDFLMGSLEAAGHAGQVSGSNHGESDIDISGLLNVSDQNFPISFTMLKKHHNMSNLGQVFRGQGGFDGPRHLE